MLRLIRVITTCLMAGSLLYATAVGLAAEAPAPVPAAGSTVTVVVNSNTPDTTTGGIQEAIDSLPSAGGIVFLPVGVYEVHRTIFMKPYTTLTGCGDGSIIRKDPALQVRLAEDVVKGSTQNYVVVQDTSKLRAGLGMKLGDLSRKDDDVLINKIEGNKVYLTSWGIYSLDTRPWKPSGALKVEKKACLFNGFPVIRTSKRCVITNLAVDGNKNAQAVDGKPLYKDYEGWWECLRCAPYIGGDSRLENCKLYDAAGVCVSLGYTATVKGCDISGSYQGIHPGAGPYSKIIGNTIHHNEDGLMLCLGNYGLIISQNHIHDNGQGIGALGVPYDRPGRCGDHFCIISDNVIYRNRMGGINSGQGKVGPEDFIITGNIIQNNWQGGKRYLDQHQVPAGICLYNARRCVISNNRCFDDQDQYPGILAEAAAAGTNRLLLAYHPAQGNSIPMLIEDNDQGASPGWTNFPAVISDDQNRELILIKGPQILSQFGRALILDKPLVQGYAKGAQIVPPKTQLWGIFVGGPDAYGNVVANNVCLGNALGGILWDGTNTSVSGNVGLITAMDHNQALSENVYPFQELPLPNAGFEDDQVWKLEKGAAFDQPGHSGKRALKLTKTDSKGVTDATYDVTKLPIKPNTRYRITAWVRSDARKADQLMLPFIFLYEIRKDGTYASTTGYAEPVRDSQFQRSKPEAMTWLKVSAEGRSGMDIKAATIYCRLQDAVGEAWVDDLSLQELTEDAAEFRPSADKQPKLEAGFSSRPSDITAPPPELTAGLTNTVFFLESGRPAANRTAVAICWDNTALYVTVQCADTDPEGIKKRVAGKTAFSFAEDCVAVLLQPNVNNPSSYYQFAVTAGGQIFNQVCSNYSGRDATDFHPDWRAMAQITANGWTAQMAIPFAALVPFPPEPGMVWGMNVGRTAYVNGVKEITAWSPAKDWHDVAAFGRLMFVK